VARCVGTGTEQTSAPHWYVASLTGWSSAFVTIFRDSYSNEGANGKSSNERQGSKPSPSTLRPGLKLRAARGLLNQISHSPRCDNEDIMLTHLRLCAYPLTNLSIYFMRPVLFPQIISSLDRRCRRDGGDALRLSCPLCSSLNDPSGYASRIQTTHQQETKKVLRTVWSSEGGNPRMPRDKRASKLFESTLSRLPIRI